jgi:WD40 repeat protein
VTTIPIWDNDATLAAGHQQVGLWDLETDSPLAAELYEPARDSSVGVHPNGRLAALSQSGLIEVIEIRTGELVETLNHPNQLDQHLALYPVVFSPNGRWLAAANGSGQVVVWDTRTWKQHETWDTISGCIFDGISMAFTPDSDFLVTGGGSQAAIWNVEQGASGGVRLEVDPGRPIPEFGSAFGTTEGLSSLSPAAPCGSGIFPEVCSSGVHVRSPQPYPG